MMKLARVLILSLLSVTSVRADQLTREKADSFTKPDANHSTQPLSATNIPLEYIIMGSYVKGFITSQEDEYPVQLGAFRSKMNAEAFLKEVRARIDKNAIMVTEDGLYKIRISRTPELEGIKRPESGKPPSQQIQAVYDSLAKYDTIVAVSGISDSTRTDSTQAVAVVADTAKTTEAAAGDSTNVLFLNEDNPWLKRISYFGKSLAFINALIITITICISTMLILLLIILFNRRRLEKTEKLRQYLMEKYQGLIIDYLFGNAKPEDFRPIASDTYRRQVLIDQMIDVSINLKGEESKKMLGLYKHLGLDRDSITRANDRRWHKKIKGFRELAFMNIKEANGAIYKALNSSNEILRMEAQIALVRLGDDNAFEFLSYLKRPFSLWEQITLHELIIQHNIQVPSFKKWLKSSNPTVVMFALRMIREFKQTDAEEDIRGTLMHKNPSVRQLAVQAAGDLNMHSTLEIMKRMYKNQDYNICLEIVRSMGKMPDLSMLGFLKLVLDKEDDVQLQIEAVKAIENNGEEGVKALVKIMKSEYKNYNIIVRHVLDRRIF
jgi:HEAT repeat protein